MRASAPPGPLKPIEYYEVMIFLIYEQYDYSALDETGSVDVGALLRIHEGQEEKFLMFLRRKYNIGHSNFMELDEIARECLATDKGGKMASNHQPSSALSSHDEPFTPLRKSDNLSDTYVIEPVQVEVNMNAGRSGRRTEDADGVRGEGSLPLRRRHNGALPARSNLGIYMWICCCISIISFTAFFLWRPIVFKTVRDGLLIQNNT